MTRCWWSWVHQLWEPLQTGSWSSQQPSKLPRHCRPALCPITAATESAAKEWMGPFLLGSAIPKGSMLWNRRALLHLSDVYLTKALQTPDSVRSPWKRLRRARVRRNGQWGRGPARQSYRITWHLNPRERLPTALLTPPAPGRAFVWWLWFYSESATGKFGARYQQKCPASDKTCKILRLQKAAVYFSITISFSIWGFFFPLNCCCI